MNFVAYATSSWSPFFRAASDLAAFLWLDLASALLESSFLCKFLVAIVFLSLLYRWWGQGEVPDSPTRDGHGEILFVSGSPVGQESWGIEPSGLGDSPSEARKLPNFLTSPSEIIA